MNRLEKINFMKDRVAVNFLAGDLDNAKAVIEAMDGHALVGILSKQFKSVEEGVVKVNAWLEELPAVSVGMGGGDPAQAVKAALIASQTNPGHVNQPFTGAGFASGALRAKGANETAINVMMAPTGIPGKVKVNTGKFCVAESDALVDVDTAMAMIKDMEADSVKFFPMGGLKSLEELKAVAEACARQGIQLIEPTGGITPDNFQAILQVCLDAGVPYVMPHVYGSVMDKETGMTNVEQVRRIYEILERIL
jgi:2-dehydro-3-deoxy-phosphogluconate aldolase